MNGRAKGSIDGLGRSVLGRRGSARLALAVALLGALVAACGSASAPASSLGPLATGAADTFAPAASVAPTTAASAPAASAAGSPPAGGLLVPVDAGLLRILPATVVGRPVVEAPAAESSAASDPGIAALAQAVAVAYVASASKGDWAIASVVALRPGTWSDDMFRSWRDTYESGACAAVGGPGGHAEASIGDRSVFIGSCGSLRIYHVHLPAPDRLVSITAVGAGSYGEWLVAGLRP